MGQGIADPNQGLFTGLSAYTNRNTRNTHFSRTSGIHLFTYDESKWPAKLAKVSQYGHGLCYTVSRHFIPRYIAVRGLSRQRILVSHMHHADFFFSGIGPSAPTGDCSVTLGGISLSGFRISIGDDEAAYYTSFDNIITGVPRSCAASFTLALAEVHDYDYVYPNSSANITAGCVTVVPETGRFSLKTVSGEFYRHALCKQGSIPPPVSKVTAQHHTDRKSVV